MSQKLASQITGLEQKLSFVSKTYETYKKEHPNTRKRPSDFERAMGKTRSSKPIFKHYSHPKHKSFGVKDHKDAAEAHVLAKHRAEHKLRGLNNEHPNAQKLQKKIQHHDTQAQAHMNKVDSMRAKRKKESAALEACVAALEKIAEKTGPRGGHIIGETKSGKPIYRTGWQNHKSTDNPRYKEFSHQDHRDAADAHLAKAKDWTKDENRGTKKYNIGEAAHHITQARNHQMHDPEFRKQRGMPPGNPKQIR